MSVLIQIPQVKNETFKRAKDVSSTFFINFSHFRNGFHKLPEQSATTIIPRAKTWPKFSYILPTMTTVPLSSSIIHELSHYAFVYRDSPLHAATCAHSAQFTYTLPLIVYHHYPRHPHKCPRRGRVLRHYGIHLDLVPKLLKIYTLTIPSMPGRQSTVAGGDKDALLVGLGSCRNCKEIIWQWLHSWTGSRRNWI